MFIILADLLVWQGARLYWKVYFSIYSIEIVNKRINHENILWDWRINSMLVLEVLKVVQYRVCFKKKLPCIPRYNSFWFRHHFDLNQKISIIWKLDRNEEILRNEYKNMYIGNAKLSSEIKNYCRRYGQRVNQFKYFETQLIVCAKTRQQTHPVTGAYGRRFEGLKGWKRAVW